MHLPWRLVAPGNGPAISTPITADETAELQRLSFESEVLEIGAGYGYSSVVMAMAGARVTSVDPHDVHFSYHVMRDNLDQYGIEQSVYVVRARSQDVLPALLGRLFDVVFINGDHAEPTVTHDITWGRRLLRPGGIMALWGYGETCCSPTVAKAVDNYFTKPPLKTVDSLYLVRP